MYRPAILGAFLLIAAPFAGLEIPTFFDGYALTAQLHDLAGGIPGLSVGHVSAARSGRAVTIQGLVLRQPGLFVRIGRLSLNLPLQRPVFSSASFMQAVAATAMNAKAQVNGAGAAAAPTGTIAADNIIVETAGLHATIKHIDMLGTRLGKADLTALFDAHATAAPAARLAKLSAAHVAISEIVLESRQAAQEAPAKPDPKAGDKTDQTPDNQTSKSWNEKIILRDIAMDDVVHGLARRATIGSTSAIVQAPDEGEMQTALGPMRAAALDLTQTARLFSAATGAAAGPRQRICDSLDIEGIKVSAPKAEIGAATVAIKDIKAGALQSLLKSVARSGPKKPATESTAGFARLLADVDLDGLAFTDLRFATTDRTTPWDGRISSGLLSDIKSGDVAQAGFENVTLTGDGAKLDVSRLGWRDVPSPKASDEDVLPNKIGPPDAAVPAGHAQKITADALDIDIGGLASRQTPPGAPTHFQLGHFEVTGSDPVDGIPTRVKAAADHFIFDIGAMKDGNFAEIAALGYGKLDLSSKLEAHFENANSEFSLDALSLSGVDMGSVQISGRVDHVTKALFSSDQAEMQAGILNVLLHSIEIRIANAGLFERIVAAAAKKDQLTPAAVRKKFSDTVTTAVPALLDHGRGSEAIAAALVKFIAQPKNFRLAVTAPDGIGALDVALIKDPAALLSRVDISTGADE